MSVVDAIAARGAARARARVTSAIAEVVPGAAIELSGDDVVVTGRGVLRDPRLRWIGGLMR